MKQVVIIAQRIGKTSYQYTDELWAGSTGHQVNHTKILNSDAILKTLARERNRSVAPLWGGGGGRGGFAVAVAVAGSN